MLQQQECSLVELGLDLFAMTAGPIRNVDGTDPLCDYPECSKARLESAIKSLQRAVIVMKRRNAVDEQQAPTSSSSQQNFPQLAMPPPELPLFNPAPPPAHDLHAHDLHAHDLQALQSPLSPSCAASPQEFFCEQYLREWSPSCSPDGVGELDTLVDDISHVFNSPMT